MRSSNQTDNVQAFIKVFHMLGWVNYNVYIFTILQYLFTATKYYLRVPFCWQLFVMFARDEVTTFFRGPTINGNPTKCKQIFAANESSRR